MTSDRDELDVLVVGAGPTGLALIRPDAYVGFRCAGTDPTDMDAYLRRWFAPAPPLAAS